MEIYEVNLTRLKAEFWDKLTGIDDDPHSTDEDVLAMLTCQKNTINSILAYGEKIEIEED